MKKVLLNNRDACINIIYVLENTMRNRALILVAILALSVPLVIFALIKLHTVTKKAYDNFRIEDLIDDAHDTTDKQRAIHRKAAESEYWERKDINAGIYA